MDYHNRILRLNSSGFPEAWVSSEQAVTLYVKAQILWTLGEEVKTIVGGFNKFGERSSVQISPIIACAGRVANQRATPLLSNALLFRRDGYRCMYCGMASTQSALTRDHIVPRVQGGKDLWTNVVAACARCNHYKGGRTPEEAGLELLAVPFTPNRFEWMYLANRKISGDQMEYLRSRFSGQRCWEAA